ncbi:hypothetical protein B0H19DRAFT_73793 [Mycena capillaripes]|nr:hypothetical protein B0H19DRAFT_73793 [Mycena capillaripes]
MDGQESAHWSAYTSAYWDPADLCLRGGLNAVSVALVDVWFTRAAGFPLSITVRCADAALLLPPNLMATIMARSAEWGRLELRISYIDFVGFNRSSGPFHLLQSLAVEVLDCRHISSWNSGLYLRAPRLQAQRLSPGSVTFPTSMTSLVAFEVWPRPDDLTLPADCFHFLDHLPRLRHLLVQTRWIYFQSTIQNADRPIRSKAFELHPNTHPPSSRWYSISHIWCR